MDASTRNSPIGTSPLSREKWSLGDSNSLPRSNEEQSLLTGAAGREGCPKG